MLRDSNLSVPAAILTTMRIRTLDGPPLPAEILAHAARAVVLADLLAGEDVSRDEKRRKSRRFNDQPRVTACADSLLGKQSNSANSSKTSVGDTAW